MLFKMVSIRLFMFKQGLFCTSCSRFLLVYDAYAAVLITGPLPIHIIE